MLETNNLYMFGPTTATTTTTTTATTTANTSTQPPSSTSTLANGNSSLRSHGTVLEHHSQQKRPVHYYQQEEQQEEEQEVDQAEKGYSTRFSNGYNNPSFGRHHHHEESQTHLNYTYKSNTSHTSKTNTINKHNHHHHPHNATLNHHHINHHTTHYLDNHKMNNYSRPPTSNKQSLYPQQQVVKREVSPNILGSPSLIKNSIEVVEDWYEHSHKKSEVSTTVETGDNKKMRRKKEMNSFIEELNQDFLQNKERIYMETMNEVNNELKLARQEKHVEYIDGLKDLEYKRQKMIDDGILFKEYQNQVTDNQFRLEIYQAEEEYTAETQEIREKLFNVLEEKRRKLKEDKDNCDLAYDVVLETQNRMHKRNLRKRGPDHAENKSNKKKQLNGPVLVYKLNEDDILSDMQAMRNGLPASSTVSNVSTTPLKKSSSTNKKK